MHTGNYLFDTLEINHKSNSEIRKAAKKLGITIKKIRFYNDENILPNEKILKKIKIHFGISPIQLKLGMGLIDFEILSVLRENSNDIAKYIENEIDNDEELPQKPNKVFETNLGKLYEGDCLNLLPHIENESFDLIFADPPFNLDKAYPSEMNDNINGPAYLDWCRKWIDECVRVLKPGGSFFLWNLPKWNTTLSSYLNHKLNLRHWIATDIKYTLPIPKRLYPSHYSLLYYIKGKKPNTFKPDRLPMEICNNCFKELKDYGGYKNKMNPKGINLTDVWYDIPPVRHSKYKARKDANELSIKLLDRIIEMSSEEGDTIFDPFGGAGTTYIVSEIKKRKWIGIELGPADVITRRFDAIADEKKYLNDYRKNYNNLFSPKILKERKRRGFWTPESVRNKRNEKPHDLFSEGKQGIN